MNITEVKKYRGIDGTEVEGMVRAVVDGVVKFVPTNNLTDIYYAEIMRQVEEGTLVIQEADV